MIAIIHNRVDFDEDPDRDHYRIPNTFFKDDKGLTVYNTIPFFRPNRVGREEGQQNKANIAFKKSSFKTDAKSYFSSDFSCITSRSFEDAVRWSLGMSRAICRSDSLIYIFFED